MDRLTTAALRGYLRVRGAEPDRGDVPGWVLVTVMTAGLVMVIWAFADDALRDVFTDAVDRVKSDPNG
jgi:hypothetical protein